MELKLPFVYLLSRRGVFKIHERETARVPELVHEEAVCRNAVGREEDVTPLYRERRERKAQRVRAVVLHDRQRVDDVSARLAHLLPLFVAYKGMDVYVVEGHFALHSLKPEHYHPGDPEEDDVKSRHKHGGRIEFLQGLCFVGPAHR